MSEMEPQITPLVVGLTRPPQMIGVPYTAFLINGMITVIAFLVIDDLRTFLICIPIHLVLFLAVSRDIRILDILRVVTTRTKRTPNKAFWGAQTYGP